MSLWTNVLHVMYRCVTVAVELYHSNSFDSQSVVKLGLH